jgi:hypothetical protein
MLDSDPTEFFSVVPMSAIRNKCVGVYVTKGTSTQFMRINVIMREDVGNIYEKFHLVPNFNANLTFHFRKTHGDVYDCAVVTSTPSESQDVREFRVKVVVEGSPPTLGFNNGTWDFMGVRDEIVRGCASVYADIPAKFYLFLYSISVVKSTPLERQALQEEYESRERTFHTTACRVLHGPGGPGTASVLNITEGSRPGTPQR